MRVGIFSDVHGNLQALEATLSSLEHRRVDQLLCLGDIATLGLQPREVINRLEKMDCKILLGNHESALLFPEKHEQFGIPKFLFPTIQWCLDQIGDFGLNFIKTFAMTEKIILNEFYSLLAFHGTPTSNFEIFDLYNDDSISETQMFFPNTNVFAGGHTHMQILQRSKTFTFINPGSAGSVFKVLPFEPNGPMLLPFSEFSIVEAKGQELLVESFRIPFPTNEINVIASVSTYPMKDWWAKQF